MAEPLSGRETLLVFLIFGITLMLTAVVNDVYRGKHRDAALILGVAGMLFYIFFRHRKVLFAIVALVSLLVTVGLNSLARPSLLGSLITAGSGAALYVVIRWDTRRRAGRGLRAQAMHKFFDKDTGDDL